MSEDGVRAFVFIYHDIYMVVYNRHDATQMAFLRVGTMYHSVLPFYNNILSISCTTPPRRCT